MTTILTNSICRPLRVNCHRYYRMAMILSLMFLTSRTEGQCSFDWKPFDGVPTPDGPVTSMIRWYDDGFDPQIPKLVVGGYFNIPGGLGKHVAAWDGNSWQAFEGITGAFSPTAQALTIYDHALTTGGYISGVNYWDGADWQFLAEPNNPNGTNLQILALAVFDGKLIAAGQFSDIGGTNASAIAQWNGSQWQPLGTGLGNPTYPPYVMDMTVFDGKLFVVGYFNSAGGVLARGIAQWDGLTWQAVGNGVNGLPYAVSVYNGHLIVGGGMSIGMTTYAVMQWNGAIWQPLGGAWTGGMYPIHTSVSALAEYNGKLVAGGSFTIAGGIAATNIAQWDGVQWQPLGNGTNGQVLALCAFGGDLFVGGGFSLAGGYSTAYWARWGPTDSNPAIVENPASPIVCENSAVSLRTTAIGDGTLSYQWRRNGANLLDDEDIFGTHNDTLVFNHSHPTDTGAYTCVVTLNNCTQTTSNSAMLTVYPTGSADGNGDTLSDGRDIQSFINALINHDPVSNSLCVFDFTAEGQVDLTDIPGFTQKLLGL